jgi:riboflavin synthase
MLTMNKRWQLSSSSVMTLMLAIVTKSMGVATGFLTTSVTTPTKAAASWPSSSSSSSLHMFTGIVEEMGTVVRLEERDDMTLWDGTRGKGTELTVRGGVVLDGAYLGCSICVSGVCLTATQIDTVQRTFTVGLAPETLRKTYFASLRPGDMVNLERASEIGGRNSGHFVQGHVDGTGTIVEKRPDGDSLAITVQVDDNPDLIRYVVPKGFIAIDGTSLTVVDVNAAQARFSFMLIEYTQKKIVIPQKAVGDKVNLEVDVLGKYSESALSALIPRIEALEARVASLEGALFGPTDPVAIARETMLSQHPGRRRRAPHGSGPSMMRPKPLTVESLSYSETQPSNSGTTGMYRTTSIPQRRPPEQKQQQQQQQQQQQPPRVSLDPRPPIYGVRPTKDFRSVPSGRPRRTDIPHQESQPDPLL